MNDTDKFIYEELLPFYKRAFDAFWQGHHAFSSVLNSFLSGKKIRAGMRVTANENFLGDYTIHLDGANISHIDNGLSPEIHTPFGIIRPYIIIEKSTLEKMILDEPNFITDPFTTKFKYYRDVTIKFL